MTFTETELAYLHSLLDGYAEIRQNDHEDDCAEYYLDLINITLEGRHLDRQAIASIKSLLDEETTCGNTPFELLTIQEKLS